MATLKHTPTSIDKSNNDGKRKKRKKAVADNNTGSEGGGDSEDRGDLSESGEASSESPKNKKKKESPYSSSVRCVLCTKIHGSALAYQTKYRCPTCCVFLCRIEGRGRSKTSCFEKWHSVTKLDQLCKKKTVQPAQQPTRTSPRRPKKPRTSPRKTKRRQRTTDVSV